MTAGLPIGSIVIWPGHGSAIPAGWKVCDGSAHQIANYPALYAALGTIYGGTGTEFNLPDYRGYFVRAVAGTSGRDPGLPNRVAASGAGSTGASVGSTQACQVESHQHDLPLISMEWDPGLQSPHQIRGGNMTDSGSNVGLWSYETAADYGSMAFGGTETRPLNIYAYYIIKCE